MLAETFSRNYSCPNCHAVYAKTTQMLLLSEAFEHEAVVVSDAPEYISCENCGFHLKMNDIVSGKADHLTKAEKQDRQLGVFGLIGMLGTIVGLLVFSDLPWIACIFVGLFFGVVPGALLYQVSKLFRVVIFFICTGAVSASNAQSSYTGFLKNNSKISWAAEYQSVVNLTPISNTISLKKYFLDQIRKDGMISYQVIDRFKSDSMLVRMPGLQRQEWLKDHYVRASDNPEHWEFRNKKAYSGYRISGFSEDSCCGCDEANAFRVNQLLVYSQAKLSTRNIFLSPLCVRNKNESDAAWFPLGNFAWNTSGSRPASSTYLTRSSVTYFIDPRDSANDLDILTPGNDMLMEHLFADIRSGKVDAHDFDSDRRISYPELLTWKMPYDTSVVYDDSMEVASYVVTQRVLDPSDFTHIRVEQNWYYDLKTDRLFSEVLSATLLLQRRLPDGTVVGFIPFVRLKFK